MQKKIMKHFGIKIIRYFIISYVWRNKLCLYKNRILPVLQIDRIFYLIKNSHSVINCGQNLNLLSCHFFLFFSCLLILQQTYTYRKSETLHFFTIDSFSIMYHREQLCCHLFVHFQKVRCVISIDTNNCKGKICQT